MTDLTRSWYSISEAARLLWVCEATVCTWIDNGKLTAIQRGNRRRVTGESVRRVLGLGWEG